MHLLSKALGASGFVYLLWANCAATSFTSEGSAAPMSLAICVAAATRCVNKCLNRSPYKLCVPNRA